MDEPRYTTAELLFVAGLTETNLRALIARGYMVPSLGRPGRGASLDYTPLDVLQARFIFMARRVGVPLRRCAALWTPVCAAITGDPNRFLIIAHRDDDSDTDFKLLRLGDDAGWDHDDAPAVAAVINLRGLMRDVAAKLLALRSAP